METKSEFLTPNTRITFNSLWLAFLKVLILCHFDLEYYIWIKINTSSYAINKVVSQLTFRINPEKIVINIYLIQ